jgi:hypothetical protein
LEGGRGNEIIRVCIDALVSKQEGGRRREEEGGGRGGGREEEEEGRRKGGGGRRRREKGGGEGEEGGGRRDGAHTGTIAHLKPEVNNPAMCCGLALVAAKKVSEAS